MDCCSSDFSVKKPEVPHKPNSLEEFETKYDLEHAIENQGRKLFAYLLKYPHLDINSLESTGASVLVWAIAAYRPDWKTAKKLTSKYFIINLLKRGADVNFINTNTGYTALHAACLVGYEDCISLLLDHGADPTLSTRLRVLPFNLAATSGCSQDTVETLFKLTIARRKRIELEICAVCQLIYNNWLNLLEKLISKSNKLIILHKFDWFKFLNHLDKLPFKLFKIMTHKFPSIVHILKTSKNVDLSGIVKSTDVADYLRFFCRNCGSQAMFDVMCLVSDSVQLPIEILTEVVCVLVSRKVKFSVDLDQLYARYGFSPLFEKLLHMDMKFVCFTRGPYFVPVWYNTAFVSREPPDSTNMFKDEKFYFAKNGPPSLLEFARDAVRKNFIKDNGIKNHMEFAKFLQDLPISTTYKDLLTFKRRLYQ